MTTGFLPLKISIRTHIGGGVTPPSYTVTEDGGTIASGEAFTIDYSPGGLLALNPTAVRVGGVESSSIVIVDDNTITAVAGNIPAGPNSMEICP